jgi:hypothetical protein
VFFAYHLPFFFADLSGVVNDPDTMTGCDIFRQVEVCEIQEVSKTAIHEGLFFRRNMDTLIAYPPAYK